MCQLTPPGPTRPELGRSELRIQEIFLHLSEVSPKDLSHVLLLFQARLACEVEQPGLEAMPIWDVNSGHFASYATMLAPFKCIDF